MRVVWRDGNDNVIAGDSNEFNLTVKGTEEESGCEDAYAELTHSVSYDQDLLFNATEFVKNINIKNTLSVNVYGNSHTVCKPLFKLYVWNPESEKWVSWSQLKQWLQDEVPHHLNSKIEFNSTTSEISASFSKDDVEAIREFFIEAEKSTIQLKVTAIIPGSIDFGATAEIDDLISASFSIVLIDSSVADTCRDN